jgi:hypothetical protein
LSYAKGMETSGSKGNPIFSTLMLSQVPRPTPISNHNYSAGAG